MSSHAGGSRGLRVKSCVGVRRAQRQAPIRSAALQDYENGLLTAFWVRCVQIGRAMGLLLKTREAASVLLALARFFAVHDLRLPWLWAAQKR